MFSAIVSRLIILFFGTLYPAYASYKAVKTKNVKEYVKWMMYWIVFALFTCAETVTDVFLSWFPFYYEIKIIIVLWLLSPATKGSSILYRKFVHPMLSKREQEIDEYISKAKEQSYHTVLNLGTKGVNYATNVIMQTAIKGGGGLVNQLKKSYSLSDLSTERDNREDDNTKDSLDEIDDVVAEPRFIRARGRGFSPPQRSVSGPNKVDMYFPEMDVDVIQAPVREPLSHIRSIDDISSGYSSTEYVGQTLKPENVAKETALVRTASVGGSTRAKVKSTRSAVTTKKAFAPAEDVTIMDEFHHRNQYFDTLCTPSIYYLFHQAKLFNYPQIVMVDTLEQTEQTNKDDFSNDDSSSTDFSDTLDFPNDFDINNKLQITEIEGNIDSSNTVLETETKSEYEEASNVTSNQNIEENANESATQLEIVNVEEIIENITVSSNTEDESDSSTLKSEMIPSLNNSVSDCTIINDESMTAQENVKKLDTRLGRYNKRRAPLPPPEKVQSSHTPVANETKTKETTDHIIKNKEKTKLITAKLVLKQGFLKESKSEENIGFETTV